MTQDPASSESSSSAPAPLTDPIGLALTAIAAGSTAGAFVITVGVSLLRVWQGASSPADGNQTGFLILTVSVMLGSIVGAATTLLVTRRINDLWRRSVAAAIAVFCALLLSTISAPVDLALGGIGLLAFAVALLVTFVMLTRRALTLAHR